MSELAPPLHPVLRRWQQLDAIGRREEQIAVLITQQRLDIAGLFTNDRGGVSERQVRDELALLWRRSPRQAENRLINALVFADFPDVHARIADGTWLLDHADAVIEELQRSGLTRAQKQQVLDLVLSRNVGKTPWELRAAVRTAIVILFPDHAMQRAEKAKKDRDVQSYPDAPGVASLLAHGPAQLVEAMMASLEALTWPPAAEDPRSAAQRRFDALYDLVCGRAQPGQWQAQVLVSLATVQGEDELPAELIGHGPLPAPLAREIVATGASLRRVIVDEHGQLVAVDPQVHRADQPGLIPTQRRPAEEPPAGLRGSDATDDAEEPDEPDPDAPSAADLAWLEETTWRSEVYADEDSARSRAQRAARRQTPDTDSDGNLEGAGESEGGLLALPSGLLVPHWSAERLATVLHRVRTDPVQSVDLSTDRYAVPIRLKRHLVLRDRTCVFPGCPRPARHCDKDHLLPWPRGATSEPNLANECEPHHLARHHYFTVTRLPNGTIRWTSPTGLFYDRPPRPVLLSAALMP